MKHEKHPVLGQVVIARKVLTTAFDSSRARRIIMLLAASVGLMMTGVGIIMPVFARRLSEFGDGVEALGLMTMAFALAQLIAAPFMGSLADRIGRRPLILIALAAFTLTNIGYLFARSTITIIIIRAFGGLFTAGLFPASMGVVADVFNEKERARWIGIIMGGYGVGFIFGPALGGFLYDAWGFIAPFVFSAGAALFAFIAAIIQVSETRPASVRRRENLRQNRLGRIQEKPKTGLLSTLPKPLTIFAVLLFIDFIGSFAFAFVEPQMIFYIYDELGWSTTRFGVLVGVYGLSMVIGQMGLGTLSDRIGRKPVIIIGQLLNTVLFASMAFATNYYMIILMSLIAGLGAALTAPALSAYFLDITAEQYRSRVVGIKESSLALGGVLGPLLVVGATQLFSSQGIFIIAGLLVIVSAGLAFVLLKEPAHIKAELVDPDWEISTRRSIAAQSAMRGIVLQANAVRRTLPEHFRFKSFEDRGQSGY